MSDFDGPLGKIRLGYKVVETLGWRWAVTRLYLEAEHRSGVLKRRTPPTTWDAYELQGDPWFRLGGLYPEAAGECLRAQPAEVEDGLRQHLEFLKDRHFDVFGTRVRIDDWHHDPIDKASYPPNQHWTKVRELPEADLKLVWEPSRFSWVFDLARLHALDPTSPAPEVFWGLFEDWCANNQPHQGVNWKCGQEAAIRFMAVTFAVKAFQGEGLTDERKILLAKFADVTARRIKAHWRYAKSQDNNHIVSEAVGLIGLGTLFPKLAFAPDAVRLGERLLCQACERLVFEDGGTSQYSSNYHRVFVDNFIWAVCLYRNAGLEAPEPLTSALKRAGDFMCAITNPVHGDMASYGNNDGAHLLPLATNAFRDVRSTLQAIEGRPSSQLHRCPPESSQSEMERWLGSRTHIEGSRPPTGRTLPFSTASFVYRNAGVATIQIGGQFAILQTARPRFRISHSDLGHLEAWIDGKRVLLDLGSPTYLRRRAQSSFIGPQYHNAPRPADNSSPSQLGRFLWDPPTTVRVRRNRFYLELHITYPGFTFTRVITSESHTWIIDDVTLSDLPMVRSMCLPNDVQIAGAANASYCVHQIDPLVHGYHTSPDSCQVVTQTLTPGQHHLARVTKGKLTLD